MVVMSCCLKTIAQRIARQLLHEGADELQRPAPGAFSCYGSVTRLHSFKETAPMKSIIGQIMYHQQPVMIHIVGT